VILLPLLLLLKMHEARMETWAEKRLQRGTPGTPSSINVSPHNDLTNTTPLPKTQGWGRRRVLQCNTRGEEKFVFPTSCSQVCRRAGADKHFSAAINNNAGRRGAGSGGGGKY